MKKHHLKFLPLMAAVLLATSCSKDDENNAPANGRDGVHAVSTSGIPFSIKVNTGNSLKKIDYAPDGTNAGQYNITFNEDDVTNELTMIILEQTEEGYNPLGKLTLKDKGGNFSGTLEKEPTVATLTAEITVTPADAKTFSDESLTDLLDKCSHTFRGTFQYNTDETVSLTDQNAYLAISMSPCCEHTITFNGQDDKELTFTVKDGRIWVAVPTGQDIKCTQLGIEKSFNENDAGKIYTVARQYFTVSAQKEVDGKIIPAKRVYFSPGNLQYNATPQEGENQWRFAPTQYSICHTTNDNVGEDYDGWKDGDKYKWTDLFGWGTWLDGTGIEQPYETQTNDATNYIWNGSSAMGDEWTLLTGGNTKSAEWYYLFKSRAAASAKYGEGTVDNVHGVILLPDDWTYPTDLSESSTSNDKFKSGSSAWSNSYTADDWKIMEKNGAVFLPAAGYRRGTDVYGVGGVGNYWSSSANDEGNAYRLYFLSDSVGPDGAYGRYSGLSVRLVRAL